MIQGMTETVTDIIVSRSREDDRLALTMTVSVAAHIALMALLILKPDIWRGDFDDEPRTVMNISLGGPQGPRQGVNPMGGRTVQAPAPDTAKPQPATPPAPKAPEMTLPTKDARTPPQPKTTAPEATSRKPTTGAEVREGSTRTDTGARGQGFGLATGGGGGAGAYLDVGDFCCPEYLERVVQRIQEHWSSKQNMAGTTLVKATIRRDGTLVDVQVERPSGLVALDMTAHRAVMLTQRVPPLPAQFPNQTLTVHFRFEYHR
jgi:protein TonB